MKRLKEYLSNISGGKVLDVGTRKGEFILKLKDGLKDYSELIGIDFDEKTIETTKEKYGSDMIHFLHMDALDMNFEDQSFDLVCISNTLHHLPDVMKALTEMKRVLKPGGLLIVNEMFSDDQDKAQLTHVYLHHIEGAIDTILGECHNETFKKQEIISAVKDAGVNVIDVFEDYETKEGIKDKLAARVMSIDQTIEKVKDFPQYEELKRCEQEVRQKFAEVGIDRSTQLVVVGRK